MALPLPQLPIPGLVLQRFIGQGARSRVYEARSKSGDRFAVKVLSSEFARSLELRKEAAALARLHHPNLVQIEEINEVEGVNYLVMEYVQGVDLATVLRQKQLTEANIVTIAIDIAKALAAVHSRGIIHRDIKPANIVLQPNGVAKIIDFGFAARVTQVSKISESGAIFGTGAYCSPEQIGAIHREIDGRSDLYSLGCVLYECTTGSVPIPWDDPTKALQSHLTYVPPAVNTLNPTISPAFAAIIAKLLAKDPDDRYQTAEALQIDLENLEGLNQAYSQGLSLALGQATDLGLSTQQAPLVGRTDELNKLMQLWSQALASRGSMVQVEAEPGGGKTRLVRDFLQKIDPATAIVLSGKANQLEASPFGPFREAIHRFVITSLKASPREREVNLNLLKTAAGEFAPILKRLFRELETICDPLADIPPLDPVNEEIRFYQTVTLFFLNMVQLHLPAIIFIDDIQWLDGASKEILRRLANEAPTRKLLIITAARNDPASEEARIEFVQTMGESLQTTLALAPLADDAAAELVAYHLGGKHLEGSILTRLLSLVHGNPFVLTEALYSLLEQGVLRPQLGGWVLDSSSYKDVSLPSDVIQILINRISVLSKRTINVLSSAALIGFKFEEALLNRLYPPQDVHAALSDGVRNSVIERDFDGYVFVHDRVREVCIQRLSDEQRKDLNQQLADLYEQNLESTPAHYYALARFLKEGRSEREENKQRALPILFQAGRYALDSHSHEEAFNYLNAALEFALDLHLSDERINPLREALAEAASQIGRQQFARTLLTQAYSSASTETEKARIQYLLSLVSSVEGNCLEAWNLLQESLASLKANISKSKIMQAITFIGYWIGAYILFRTGWAYGRAKGAELERRKMISTINQTANLAGYFLGYPILMAQNTVRELYNVQWLPIGPERVRAHSFYAIFISSAISRIKSVDYHRNIALSLATQLGDNETLAYARFACNGSMMMAGDFARGEPLYVQTFPQMNKYVSAWDRTCFFMHMGGSLTAQGRTKEAIRWLHESVRICIQSENLLQTISCQSMLYWNLSIVNRRIEAEQLKKELDENFAKLAHFKLAQTFYYGSLIAVMFDREDYSQEVEIYIQKLYEANQIIWQVRIYYFIIAYLRLEQLLNSTNPTERAQRLKTLNIAIKKATFPHSYLLIDLFRCHLYTLRAALAREAGKYKKAWKYLQRAEEAATKNNSQIGLWFIARERARTAAKENKLELTKYHAKQAYDIAQQREWTLRTGHMRRLFSSELTPSSHENLSHALGLKESSSGSGTPNNVPFKRTLDALLQVSLASVRVLDPDHLTILTLDQVLKNLAAERGFFFQWDATAKQFVFKCGRDTEGNSLAADSRYSTTVIDKVGETHTPLIVTGTEEGIALGAESIVAHNLRSIMAAPVLLGERLLGVLYVDSRVVKGLFNEEDLTVFQAMANHIALNWETARTAHIELEKQALAKDLAAQAALQKKEHELAAERIRRAHYAGMAEVSTGTLHSIGNWLSTAILAIANIKYSKTATQNSDSTFSQNMAFIDTALQNINSFVETQQQQLRRESLKEPINLEDIIDEALKIKSNALKNAQVKVNKSATHTAPILTERNKILNVLINLVDNSIEAMSTTTPEKRRITIELSPTESEALIRFTDTGVGIDPRIRDQIFRFGFTTKNGGHGFGLHSSANSMVELGGKIELADPGLDKGAAFLLHLPLAEANHHAS